jgi:hypothetical protein
MPAADPDRKHKHLPLSPEQLWQRWLPPDVRKSQPPPSVPAEVRKDKRQLSLWASWLTDDDDVAEASAQPVVD